MSIAPLRHVTRHIGTRPEFGENSHQGRIGITIEHGHTAGPKLANRQPLELRRWAAPRGK
jgi:hypothetical protein